MADSTRLSGYFCDSHMLGSISPDASGISELLAAANARARQGNIGDAKGSNSGLAPSGLVSIQQQF